MPKSSDVSITYRPKIIVVMPAHNAEKTLISSFKKLPREIIDEVILVDDGSTDRTCAVAKSLHIKTYRNPFNLGYGGNLKICLTKALEHGADVIIEYHPDNQYDPKNLPVFIEKAKGGYDFALGSRFIHPREALDNKMPLVKFIANRALSFIDQFVLGIELSEFHSGFRMYSRKMLTSVAYLQNSDDYLFSFEIIVQAVFARLKIAEVPISCKYHKQIHTANLKRSSIYALGTFKTLTQYLVSKFLGNPTGPFNRTTPVSCPLCKGELTKKETEILDAVSEKKFSVYFCLLCQMGFTYPQPKNFAAFYPKEYYSTLKSFLYTLLQGRRPQIIKQYKTFGKLLDIGCGDGNLSRSLPRFAFTGIESPFSEVRNPLVKTVGIENMREKPASFDVVCFWESFEHLQNPMSALFKIRKVIRPDGFLIIECPNFSSFERQLFGPRWFHYDPPRHTHHFTPRGLERLLNKAGFFLVEQRQLYAPEYTPLGLAQSLLYSVSQRWHIVAQKEKSRWKGFGLIFMALILMVITLPLSVLLYYMNSSPILLTIAQPRKT